MKRTIRKIYFENTLFSFIVLAIIVFFVNVVFPDIALRIISYTIPLFIVVICIEIYFIRESLEEKLLGIEEKLDNQFLFQSFNSGEDFDIYFANRLQGAEKLKIIHIGSYIAREGENRNYQELLEKFVLAGGSIQRVISKSNNSDMMSWFQTELLKLQSYKYRLYYLDEILTKDIRTMGIIIVDEEEVILGGSHYNPNFPKPLISTRNINLTQFYLDYFSYLRDYSRPISHNDKIFSN